MACQRILCYKWVKGVQPERRAQRAAGARLIESKSEILKLRAELRRRQLPSPKAPPRVLIVVDDVDVSGGGGNKASGIRVTVSGGFGNRAT